ncbi:Hsp70 family protein [Micromonospora musae]|uniref:Hsp70 family protein n=1 Tax=Micromonospora musae TaxID=1894970 RepID=UPI0011C35C03|nr:hypothetical protein [Micromonospora musae]
MLKPKVVAAVDFGTHATGYAWSVISPKNEDAKQRHIIYNTRWLSQPVPYPKNLTALLVDENRDPISWGYDARKQFQTRRSDSLRFIRGFKMGLLKPRSEEALPAGEASSTEGLPLSTGELITAYLRYVYALAVDEISRSGYKEEEIRWCVTVPAIWDDYQKQAMRESAVAAGFPGDSTRLIFAIEPEAAAHYARIAGLRTLSATAGKRASLLSPGSRFMVVDCGGGTVDITAYRANSQSKLIEIGNDHGGPLGSEYVNRYFVDQVLSRKFGSYDTLASIIEAAPRAFLDMLDVWERTKVASGQELDEIFIPLPLAVDRLLSDTVRDRLAEEQSGITDHLVITAEEAAQCFESVLPGILQLVDRQLADMPSTKYRLKSPEIIVLVGGFARSAYLQRRLTDHVGERAELLVPGDPELAVLVGAAHFAYSPQTRARRTRFTYGCETSRPFRDGIDPLNSLRTVDGERHCVEHFDAFVKSSDIVEVGHSVTRKYVPLYDESTDVEMVIYRTRSRSPRYSTDPGSQRVGSVSVDLTSVMHLPRSERSVVVTMHFGDTELRVSAALSQTGKTVDATLQFDPA